MKNLKQCDPAWKSVKLGLSDKTLCSAGCVTTCLSYLSQWYGQYVNPGKLAGMLIYTQDGLLNWKSIDPVLPFRFVWRYDQRDDAKIKQILFSKNEACILQVNNYKHWVAVIGYSRLYGFKIFDPYYGDVVYLKTRYKDINGFTEVTRK
jgi:hypothetical protein